MTLSYDFEYDPFSEAVRLRSEFVQGYASLPLVKNAV